MWRSLKTYIPRIRANATRECRDRLTPSSRASSATDHRSHDALPNKRTSGRGWLSHYRGQWEEGRTLSRDAITMGPVMQSQWEKGGTL